MTDERLAAVQRQELDYLEQLDAWRRRRDLHIDRIFRRARLALPVAAIVSLVLALVFGVSGTLAALLIPAAALITAAVNLYLSWPVINPNGKPTYLV